MAATAWNKGVSAAGNAHRRLPLLAHEYFVEGRRLAAHGAPSPEVLHAFRLRTKRFRYTLELFRSVYGDALEEYLGALRKVQNYLGDINDCATTRALVLQAMPAPSPLRRKVERALDARSDTLTMEFLRWWRAELGGVRQEARWRAFLAQRQPRVRAAGAKGAGA